MRAMRWVSGMVVVLFAGRLKVVSKMVVFAGVKIRTWVGCPSEVTRKAIGLSPWSFDTSGATNQKRVSVCAQPDFEAPKMKIQTKETNDFLRLECLYILEKQCILITENQSVECAQSCEKAGHFILLVCEIYQRINWIKPCCTMVWLLQFLLLQTKE